MKKKLLTMNLGNFMASKCRDSYRAAADRWGAEYLEVTTPPATGQHHYWQKLLLHRHVPDDCQVFQIDADMLIRFDCPSPFDLVDRSKIGMVGSNPLDPDHGTSNALSCNYWSKELSLPRLDPMTQHFNSGVQIYSTPQHRKIFEEAHSYGKKIQWREKLWAEETILSLLLHRDHVPMVRLPKLFNQWYCPHKWEEMTMRHSMSQFIYHFAGPNNRKFLSQVSWRRLDHQHGRVDAILRRLPSLNPMVTEVGVWRGYLSSRLLAMRSDLRLSMLDIWETPLDGNRSGGMREQRTHQAVYWDTQEAWRGTEFAGDRRELLYFQNRKNYRRKQPMTIDRKPIERHSQDMVFLDSIHSFEHVTQEFADWWPKVKPGGYIGGHDVDSPYHFHVTQAVSEFAREHSLPVEFDRDSTWFIRKPL